MASLLLTLVVASGCAFTDPGEGTRTLQVVGGFVYRVDAAGTGGDTVADVLVTSKEGAAVTATVVATDVATGKAFTLTGLPGTGHYAGTLPGYRRQLQLRVTAGDDNLRCRIEAPGRHQVEVPSADAVRKGSAEIVWRTDDGLTADEVDVDLAIAGLSRRLDDDSGVLPVPDGTATGADILSVVRRNRVIPAGGANRSLVTAAVEVDAAYPAR